MPEKNLIAELEAKARTLRLRVVEMIGVGPVGHLGGSCSLADIVAALYFHKMKVNPADPENEDRDRFLLSKGHAALIQYAALSELGFFSKEELKKLKQLGAMLQGHPDKNKTPGIEANTGSLGQGLSVANGMALGLRLNKSPRRVYVIMGDGEIAEGQVWEAAMASSYYKIDNLTAILDRNRLMATGPIVDRYNTNPVKEKWEAFGWKVLEIDGHNMEQILEALDKAETIKGQPTLILASTVKGKGICFAENNAAFHNGAMDQEQYSTAINDLTK